MIRNIMLQLGMGAGLLAASGAWAANQSCEVVLSGGGIQATAAANSYYSLDQLLRLYPECFSATRGAAAQSALRGNSANQVAAVSSVVGARTASGNAAKLAMAGSGLAAGEAGGWNLWANGGQTVSDYNAKRETVASHESRIGNLVFGADTSVGQKTLLGLSLALDQGYSEAAHAGNRNRLDSRGYSLAPYLAHQIDSNWSVDASAGVGAGTVDNAAQRAHSARYFLAANLNHQWWLGDYQFSSKFGWLHSEERFGDMTVNGRSLNGTAYGNRLDQLRIGGQLSRYMNGWVPYFAAGYVHDLDRSSALASPIGSDALQVNTGINFISVKDKFTTGVNWSHELLRSHSRGQSLMCSTSWRF